MTGWLLGPMQKMHHKKVHHHHVRIDKATTADFEVRL
jgi:hypothetical protein